MVQETGVESPGPVMPKTQKAYLMPLYLTPSIIRYGSRVKWSNPWNRVAPSPTLKRKLSGHPRLWSPNLLTYLNYRWDANRKSGCGNNDKEELKLHHQIQFSVLLWKQFILSPTDPGKVKKNCW